MLDRLAVDIDGEMGRLVEGRVERADRNDRRPGRRLVELVGDVLGRGRDEVVRNLPPEGVDPVRPVVGRDELFRLRVAREAHSQKIAAFPLRPAGGRNVRSDRVEVRMIGRRGRPQPDGEMVAVEGEEMDQAQRPVPMTVVGADPDLVAPAGSDEPVGRVPEPGPVDVDEQAAGRGRAQSADGVAEFRLESFEDFFWSHDSPPPVQRKKCFRAANIPRSTYRFFPSSCW